MNIINQYEKEGYIFTEYDNSTVTKEIKQVRSEKQTDNVLSDTEIAILDTSLNVEYLVCLSDLNI
ncbi:hypothetical protein [Anaerofustis sp.]|uniref:hypothetical protein n=1 Tax=Anaerofustis sp. TaxID=1872517 RepID=UPI0025C25783|nr:hypothetical protein [Anaerofustis sp.]